MVQIHRQDVRNTIEEFRRRFPVGMRINISTTTEIVNESSETLTGVASLVTSPGSPIQTDLTKALVAIDDIRGELNRRYPDVNDSPETDHPMIAVDVVLISAIILETTDIGRLVEFTGYSPTFISAVGFNMIQNKLWIVDGSVDSHYSRWFSPNGLVSDDREFWEHIDIACGTVDAGRRYHGRARSLQYLLGGASNQARSSNLSEGGRV